MEKRVFRLGGFFLVAGLTLAGAYYFPLYRTHAALLAEYATLAQRARALEQDSARARADLGAEKARNEELVAKHRGDVASAQQRAERARKIQATLASKLERYVGQGELSLGTRDGHAVVTLPSALTPNRDPAEVTPSARLALCDVAAALSSGIFRMTVVTYGDGAGAHGPWDLAATRAASVARTIEQKCRFPGEHLATMSRLRPDGPSEAAGSGALVDLEIDPLDHE